MKNQSMLLFLPGYFKVQYSNEGYYLGLGLPGLGFGLEGLQEVGLYCALPPPNPSKEGLGLRVLA